MGIEHALNVMLLLMILATIAERCTEILKGPFRWMFRGWKRRYGADSKEYEYRVGAVTLVIAFLVAAFSGADLLWLISHEEASEWFNGASEQTADPFKHWVGIALMGIAIGFGSRTWHDLAAQLTNWKQVKRQLSGKDPGATEAKQSADVRELAEAAVELNSEQWFNEYENLEGVSVARKEVDGVETKEVTILFEVDAKQDSVPKRLPSVVTHGNHSFNTDVIASGEAHPAEFRPSAAPLKLTDKPSPLGNSVSRVGKTTVGTLGLRVKRGDRLFALTCLHVVCPDELKHHQTKGNESLAFSFNERGGADARVLVPGVTDGGTESQRIGVIEQAKLDPKSGLDAALIRLDPNMVSNEIFSMAPAPTGFRQLRARHLNGNFEVRLCGRSSRLQTGRVLARGSQLRVKYRGGKRRMRGLIRLTKMAVGGDSGAAIIDRDDRVIGIVVASSRRFSYAMPIAPLLRQMKVELDT